MPQRTLALLSVLLFVGNSTNDDVAHRLTGSLAGLELTAPSSGEQRRILPPRLGMENQPCRKCPISSPCDPGLTCIDRDNESVCVSERRGLEVTAPTAPSSGEQRRILPPQFGTENQPCRKCPISSPCDPGLTCKVTDNGSYATSLCVSERRGGEGQQCRDSAPRCDHGLSMTGLDDCKCLHIVGGGPKLGAGREIDWPDYQNEGPRLGAGPQIGWPDIPYTLEQGGYQNFDGRRRALPPRLGQENQPCRNTKNACNYGLTCIEKSYGYSIQRICVHNRPSMRTGGEGQLCHYNYGSSRTCDHGLKPVHTISSCRCRYLTGGYRRAEAPELLNALTENSEESADSDELAAPETTRRIEEEM